MQDTLFSAQSDFRFDGRRLLDILRRRALMIAAATVLAPVVAFLYTSRQAPIYRAQASIVIDSNTPQYLGSGFRDIVDIESNWWSSQESLNTQYRIIQSRSTSLATAQTLCEKKPKLPDGTLIMQRLVGDASCSPANLEAASWGIQGRLEVTPVKDSRVVNLIVRDVNANVAAALANAVAETYIKQNLERRLETTEGAATWLGDEYGDLAAQLNAAEQALVNFKKANNVLAVNLDDQQNEISQRRRKIVDEQTAVELKLVGINAQREQYKNLQHVDPLRDTAPQLQDNPVIQRLKETYFTEYQKLVELRGKYLDKHPSVIAQEARLEAMRADIKNETRLTLESIERAYAAIVKQDKDLRAKLDQTTREGLALEQRATEYNRLKRVVERLHKLSEQVGGREKESALAAHLKTNNVRMLDRAMVPSAAIRSNPMTTGSIALVVGFILGFALAFLLDLLDSTVKTQEDIEERLKLPFLGVIPRIQASERVTAGVSSIELYIHGKPKSPVAECMRSIRTSLVFMSPDKPIRTMLVTSGEPQEGKSTTAVNLAITMAQSGQRVLLVDTDMRRPRMHKIFKLPSTGGFSSVIAGEAKIDDMVRQTEVTNLFVMPCGPIPPNPAELIHSERCKVVVAELGQKFDRVVFDSPPLGVVTDAAILSQLCDGTVLVAKSAKTSRELLFRARKQLVDLKSNILGCVLNDLDLASRRGYGYRYYHYRYGRYYQEESKAGSKAG